ncbi:MAG: hypothetical protein ACR2HO_00755 [Rubrobacteraceae bacterium]
MSRVIGRAKKRGVTGTAHGNSSTIAGTATRAYPNPIEPWITAPAATATARTATTVTIDV